MEIAKRNILNTLFDKHLKTYFSFEIGYCNAHQPYSFQRAYLECPQFLSNKRDYTADDNMRVPAVQLHNLLPTAFQVLRPEETDGIKVVRLPDTSTDLFKQQQEALKCLTTFLENYKDHENSLNLIRKKAQESETDACGVLAAHIFSQLVPGGEVIINRSMKGLADKCPCSCGRVLTIQSTGIGNKKVWHGYPDLLVKDIAISIKPTTDEEGGSGECDNLSASKRIRLEESEELYPAVEINNKLCSLYDKEFSTQMISQAITNGFAQKQNHKFVKRLVPSIGCTLNKVLFFLYDPDEDILLRRKDSLDLMDQDDRLILPAIVELWFILNLHIFGASMSEAMCSRLSKSGFRSHLKRFGGLTFYEQSLLVAAERNELMSEGIELDPHFLASKHAFNFIDH